MEILKFTIAAGETKRFERAGRYIEVIEADSALSLFFFDENGGQAEDAQGIFSGLYIEEPYKAFTVYSAAAQLVTLLIADGRGGSRRQPGNVAVIDKVDASCMTVSVANSALGVFANVMVAPALNLRGALLRASIAYATPGAGGASHARLIAALTAPVSLAVGANSIILNSAYSNASGVTFQSQLFEQRRQVPPGWGIWVVTQAITVAAVNAGAEISFELL